MKVWIVDHLLKQIGERELEKGELMAESGYYPSLEEAQEAVRNLGRQRSQFELEEMKASSKYKQAFMEGVNDGN